ncbi:hypothetical protein Emag_003075 [Eimeria magna]
MGMKLSSVSAGSRSDLVDRRATAHFKKILLGIAFFIYHSAAIVILHNGASWLLCQRQDVLHYPGEPFLPHHFYVRWLIDLDSTNTSSIFAKNSFLPFRYGLAGLISSNVIIVGLLYAAYIVTVGLMVLKKLKEDSDSRKVQSRVISLDCAYIAASGISFFANLIAVYGGIGDFVALEPAVFFTASRTMELNIGTIIMVIALLAMFGVGYHEQNQMESSGKNISSISSVAVATQDEARRALEEALHETPGEADRPKHRLPFATAAPFAAFRPRGESGNGWCPPDFWLGCTTMKRSRRSSVCPLAYGLLADGGATVDSYLIDLCRPHQKPPSALLPVALHPLPSPSSRTELWSSRKFQGIHFAPHEPSLLFACCSDGALLGFDMAAGAFFSEIQLSSRSRLHSKQQTPFHNVSCVHMSRCAGAPLIFTGTSGGDILIFDARVSGLTAAPPALRLSAAHNGGLCGIRDGVDLRPHLFLTGGREDRWLRLFDLRFPFHYSSGESKDANHVPYPLEATHLGPHADEGKVRSSLMAFDVSSDGTLLAASVTHCCAPSPGAVEGEDGETVLLSLRDGARTIKTIASADACAAEFIQFSPNGKYLLRTGGAQAAGVPADSEGTVSAEPADWSAQSLNRQSVKEKSAEAESLLNRCTSELRQKDLAGDCKASTCGTQISSAVTDALPQSHNVGNRCLLFPLLHPQLSQFVAACGPLHPAFVRAEASTAPFTCTLWGGLVVGFGGSTADLRAGRRLYEGLKLWDSTTGVVLSWTEGHLASEADLRCIAPIPDVATGVLATGGSLQGSACIAGNSTPVEGLTLWSVRSRDDLLMSALNGSLALDVEPENEDEIETVSDE